MEIHRLCTFYTFFSCALLTSASAASLTQGQLDYIANSLEVQVKVVDNLQFDGAKHLFQVTLYNSGNDIIKESNWTIYFYSFFMIESDYLPKDGGIILKNENILLNHIQGCLFSLEPVSGFGDIESKGTKYLKFYGQNWAVSKSDIPPNWYIVAPNLEPKVIRSTTLANSRFVANFVLPKQWKRYKGDRYNPFTPEERYRRYQIKDLGGPGKLIIPTPVQIRIDQSSHVTLDIAIWRIRAEAGFAKEAQYLSGKTRVPVETDLTPDMSANTISMLTNNTMGEEEYLLLINPTTDTIVIKGKTSAGIFYGVQSLLSLLAGNENKELPEAEVRDQPRFEYRGMHIDVARNFHGKEDIYRLLDVMSMYKMNKLHFHLTDDEGWRIEIQDLPELTNIGSKRCHDLDDERCLIPQLGSGPDERSSGSGFYTRKDYIDIVRYANDRHIEVIPEVDVPGHARAAIKAMEARFKRLSSEGQPDADKYRLIDPVDSSDYFSVQMFNDNAVNPCIESTYNFIAKVVDDLISMHAEAGQPLKIFHFGGDEVAPGAWEHSPACNSTNVANTESKREVLKQHLAQRIANITYERGLMLAGWEDGLMDENKNPYKRNLLSNSDVLANAWDNVWEWGVAKRAYALANEKYKVILSHATHLYFDHPYEPDPEERGLYWAPRFTDTFKAFSYNADDLYKNIDVRRSGEPITKGEVCTADNSGCPSLNNPSNVIGMQGHLWSETVLTKQFFDYMIFPRILAIAERAWHKASWETTPNAESRKNETMRDWELFANSLRYKELNRLEELGIEYRVPPPGALLEGDTVVVNTEFPNLTVEYSTNYGNTWQKIPEGYKPTDNILLRTRSANGLRNSREIKLTLPTDQLMLNYIANQLHVEFNVIDNLANNGESFIQDIHLTNRGTKIIRAGTWSIYIFHIRLVEHAHFPYPDGFLINDSGIRIFHISGSLYKLSPDPDTFKSIQPSEKLILRFNAKYWQSARTDTMPNWYVAAEAFESRIIRSTEGESLSFVGPFNTEKQWKRFPSDKYDPYRPETRYTIYSTVQDLGKPGKQLLPTPYMMTVDEQAKVSITTGHWIIVQSEDFPDEVQYLRDNLNLVTDVTRPSSKYILFVKDSVSVIQGSHSNEAYMLNIDTDNDIVTITANSSAGAFYGVQSLLRISSDVPNGIEVPKTEIKDQPRFGYRGMHLDVGRNFHSVDEVKLLLNVMAMYKLNKFHFHLTDDEGWRLEIPELEELTQVGSRRCHDISEDTCLHPQLGSGPNIDSSGSGYYTVEEYRDILREAKKLHIEVIPEFDIPGHARAAIKSMERRFRMYEASGNMTAAKEYLLSEFDDPSEYLTVQFFNDNAVNPCLESTYKFIRHIIETVRILHEDIQPLSMFHFGGDEVAPGAWLNSSACQLLINSTSSLNSFTDLKKYFVARVANLAEVEGLDIGAWEDGIMKNLTHPFNREALLPNSPRNIYGFSWNNVFEWGSGDHAYVLANAGYKVVLAHATHLYFDHPYEPDPEERGYYWATRYTDTYKTFSFIPDDIYANAHNTVSGSELTPEQICKSECLKLQKPENIIGIQGALWSETVRTSSQLHSMIFPRLLALAERAWHKSEWEIITDREERTSKIKMEWEEFANTLGYKDLKILDDMEVQYRVPPPGAIIENDRLKVVSLFPGLEIEYSTDNGNTWKSATGNPVIPEKTTVKVRSRSADKARSSRIITLSETPLRVLSSALSWRLNILLMLINLSFLLLI